MRFLRGITKAPVQAVHREQKERNNSPLIPKPCPKDFLSQKNVHLTRTR